jgi:hypothetical protein
MSPRPILKRSTAYAPANDHSTHAVHFPPTPSLTRTFSAHSASTYDRSPIVVAPNSCALPERGCPGRTYSLDDPAPTAPDHRRGHPYGGRDLHPRAMNYRTPLPQKVDEDEDAERTPTRTFPSLPPLIPDLSSESDESDGFASPPAPYTIPPPSRPPYPYGMALPPSHHGNKYPPRTSYDMYAIPTTPTSRLFLPYTPSDPAYNPLPHPHGDDDAQLQKMRRRKERERRRERDRIRGQDDEYDARDDLPPPSRSSRRVSGSHKVAAVCQAMTSFSIDDGGCLGGF